MTVLQSAPVRDALSLDELLAEFRTKIDTALDAAIPPGDPVALLQFPYDANVGNHMMWLAITDYLRSRRCPVVYTAHGNNFRIADMRRALPQGTVLFIGGVTISRLWPRHAEVKRIVAEQCPGHRLVSLPSTMLFVDDADRAAAASIFGDHPCVTLMARDPLSEREARDVFPSNVRVQTVPDLALRLPPQPRISPPSVPVIWLSRDDAEGIGEAPPANLTVFDWTHDLRSELPGAYRALRASGVLSRARLSGHATLLHGLLNPAITRLYRSASGRALDYGNRVLDQGELLITDRMHPHIHAALRGQPVILLPDRFGKNRAVYDAYTHRLPGVRFMTHEEALQQLAP